MAKVSWARMKYFYGAYNLCILFTKNVSLLPFMADSEHPQKIHLSKKPSGDPRKFSECRWAIFKQLLISNQSPISFQWITIKEVSQTSIFRNLSLECLKLDFRGRVSKIPRFWYWSLISPSFNYVPYHIAELLSCKVSGPWESWSLLSPTSKHQVPT